MSGSWLEPPAEAAAAPLRAAQLRLLLCFLQHERLAEHCPVALEEWGLLETIGGCFVALDLSSDDAWWEEAGRDVGLGDASILATICAACTEPKNSPGWGERDRKSSAEHDHENEGRHHHLANELESCELGLNDSE